MKRREWSVGSSGGSGAKLAKEGSASRGGSIGSARSSCSACSAGATVSSLYRTNCLTKEKKKSDLRGTPSTPSTRKASTTGESDMGRGARTSLRASAKKKRGPHLTRNVTQNEAQKGANKLVNVSSPRRVQKIACLATYAHKYRLTKTCSLKKACQNKRNTSTPRGSSNCSERINGLMEEQKKKCRSHYHRGVPNVQGPPISMFHQEGAGKASWGKMKSITKLRQKKKKNEQLLEGQDQLNEHMKDMNGTRSGSDPGDVPKWDELYSFFPHVYNPVDSDGAKGTPSGGVTTHAPCEYPVGQIYEGVKGRPRIVHMGVGGGDMSIAFSETVPTTAAFYEQHVGYDGFHGQYLPNELGRGGSSNEEDMNGGFHELRRKDTNGDLSNDYITYKQYVLQSNSNGQSRMEGGLPTHQMQQEPIHKRSDELASHLKKHKQHACSINNNHLKSHSSDSDAIDDVHSNCGESFTIKHLPEVPSDVAMVCSSHDASLQPKRHEWRSFLTGELAMNEGGGGATRACYSSSGDDGSDVCAEGRAERRGQSHLRNVMEPNEHVLNANCYRDGGDHFANCDALSFSCNGVQSPWVGPMMDSSRHFGERGPLSHSDNYFRGVISEDQRAGGDDPLGDATACGGHPCCVDPSCSVRGQERGPNDYSLQRPRFSDALLYSHKTDVSIMHIDSLEDTPGPYEQRDMHKGDKCSGTPYVDYIIQAKNRMEGADDAGDAHNAHLRSPSYNASSGGSPTQPHREQMSIGRGHSQRSNENKNNLRDHNESEETNLLGEDYPHGVVCVHLGGRTDRGSTNGVYQLRKNKNERNIMDDSILSHSFEQYNHSAGDEGCDGEMVQCDTRRGSTYAGVHLKSVHNTFEDPQEEGIVIGEDPCSSFGVPHVRGSNGVLGAEGREEVPHHTLHAHAGGDKFAVELLYSSSTFGSNTTEGSNGGGEAIDDGPLHGGPVQGSRSDSLGRNGATATTQVNHYSPEHVHTKGMKKSSSFISEHNTRNKQMGMLSFIRSRSAHMVKESRRDCPLKFDDTTPICNKEMNRKKSRSNGWAKFKCTMLSEQMVRQGEGITSKGQEHEDGSTRTRERTSALSKIPEGCVLSRAALPNETGEKKKKKKFLRANCWRD
ncbi:hypothetical protein AK88_00373 [Plasmodium fragile]|uniref:Uncharacterized protein n=1 Tax=Plasmodium fragile TaxID=5857 RepID=A0A0D9QSU3_PLAFR|nr:uncharacterized protein AK88_00373 [Plasmodium fragile]KJP89917.1 hypothetical protein AK88_00373 [Plasmodium fragile]